MFMNNHTIDKQTNLATEMYYVYLHYKGVYNLAG